MTEVCLYVDIIFIAVSFVAECDSVCNVKVNIVIREFTESTDIPLGTDQVMVCMLYVVV